MDAFGLKLSSCLAVWFWFAPPKRHPKQKGQDHFRVQLDEKGLDGRAETMPSLEMLLRAQSFRWMVFLVS